jgi:hypothetical protein
LEPFGALGYVSLNSLNFIKFHMNWYSYWSSCLKYLEVP